MSDKDSIHSCSYYCQHPKCIERQRDELREKYIVPAQEFRNLDPAMWIHINKMIADAVEKERNAIRARGE